MSFFHKSFDYIIFGAIDMAVNVISIAIALILYDKYRDNKEDSILNRMTAYLKLLDEKLDRERRNKIKWINKALKQSPIPIDKKKKKE